MPDDYRVLHDHGAGLVLPERAVAGHAEIAMRRGAELHGREAVVSWGPTAAASLFARPRHNTRAAKLIFCGGAWTDRLVRDLGVPLTVTRQPLAWVWPKRPELFERGRMPVWIMEHRDGSNHYGFPMLPDNPGLKLASHVRSAPTDAGSLDRDAHPADEAVVRGCCATTSPRPTARCCRCASACTPTAPTTTSSSTATRATRT